MRNAAMWAAAALLSIGATIASAGGITISSTRVAGPSGFDIVRFFAKLVPDATPGQPFFGATGMQSIDATMISTGVFKFRFADLNADGIPDWDPAGTFTANDLSGRFNNTVSAGSIIRPGNPAPPDGGFIVVASTTPPNIFSRDANFDGQPDPGGDPQVNYGNLKSFEVNAAFQGGTDILAVSDTFGGLGSLIAKAVVPTGSAVYLIGTITADAGPPVSFVLDPEPNCLSLIGFGAALLGCARRRARA